MANFPTLAQLDAAPTYGSQFSGGPTYSLTFNVGGQQYSFVPKNIAENGGLTAGDKTFLMPYFTNIDNLKDFGSKAQQVDLSSIGLTKYLNGQGLADTGYLIPFGAVPFDGQVNPIPTETFGGELTGLRVIDGQVAYGLSGGHGKRYATTTGEVHDPYVTGGGGLLGDMGQMIIDLGPIAPILGNMIMPGLGTGIAMGTTIGKGGNLEDLAKGYIAAQIGNEVGAQVGAGTESPIAGNIAGNTTSGLVAGKPLDQALASAAINAGTTEGAKAISDSNLEDWSQKNAEKAYENAYSPTEQDVLAADKTTPLPSPLSTPTTETGPGYFDEETGKYIADPNGGLQAPLDNTSGTNIDSVKENADLTGLSNTQSPLDTATVLPPPSDVPPESYDPTKTSTIKAGLTSAVNNTLNQPAGGTTGTAGAAGTSAGTAASPYTSLDMLLDTTPQYLGYSIGNQATKNESVNPYELKQLYDSLDPRLAEQLKVHGIEPPNASNTIDPQLSNTKLMATGGTTSSYFTDPPIKNVTPNLLPAAPVVQTQSRLGTLKNLYSGLGSKQPHLNSGGALPSKYTEAAPKGHNPEFITGLTGYYAQGKGTGQSDDIPAMLHDGDYVADADLVAALGDGSSKAGAEALEKFRRQIPHQQSAQGGAVVPAKIADGEYVFPASFVTAIGRGDNKAGAKLLDAMREEIRAHKRSAPTSKIPPKAKSPLDYLKMVKG